MRKKNAAKSKKSRGVRSLPAKTVDAQKARAVRGGKPQKADGSLDAGIHFKYDLKAQKEA